MLEFSGGLKAAGLPTTISSEHDVTMLVDAFDAYLKERTLWQYYVFDVTRERKAIKEALDRKDVVEWSGPDVALKTVVVLANIIRESGQIQGYKKLEKRLGTHVPGPVAAGFVKAAFVNLGDDSESLADAWVRVVDVLNVPLYEEWTEDTKVALDNIRNRLKYTRLDPHGPKLGAITPQ